MLPTWSAYFRSCCLLWLPLSLMSFYWWSYMPNCPTRQLFLADSTVARGHEPGARKSHKKTDVRRANVLDATLSWLRCSTRLRALCLCDCWRYLEGSLSPLVDHLLLPCSHLLRAAISLLDLAQCLQSLVFLQGTTQTVQSSSMVLASTGTSLYGLV